MAVVEDRFRIMAVETHVIVVDGTEAQLSTIRSELARLEQCWSRFLPDSDISRINRAADDWVTVDPSTCRLLRAMTAAFWLTEGRFDPSILPALVAAGYGTSARNSEHRTELPAGPLRSSGGLGALGFDAEASRVRGAADVMIDPGGLGKGLAADLATQLALDLGAAGALVNIGGDLRVRGVSPSTGRGWPIGIEDPVRPDRDLAVLTIDDMGIATSGPSARSRATEGSIEHHLVDPATEQPVRSRIESVTTVSDSGWFAEAAATAASLTTPGEGLRLLSTIGVDGLIVDTGGTQFTTDNFERYVS